MYGKLSVVFFLFLAASVGNFKMVMPMSTMTGAPVPADLSDETLQELKQHVLKAYHEKYLPENVHKLVEVTDITTQVVAGVLYRMKVIFGATACKLNMMGVMEGQQCKLLSGAGAVRCEASIYEKPWQNYTAVEFKDCTHP